MLLQEKLKNTPILLGSKSPRRRDLLASMGLKFEVHVRQTDETFDPMQSPEFIVRHIAESKLARFDQELSQNMLVICADTIVVDPQGAVLGKPTDAAQATAMMQTLSGTRHRVFTGVSFGYHDVRISFVGQTTVWFNILDPAEISFYVENNQPFDKAGGYGIQEWIGRIGVEKIEGSYENVMGLPTAQLQQELKKIFLG